MTDFTQELFNLNILKNFDQYDLSKAPDQQHSDKDEMADDQSSQTLSPEQIVSFKKGDNSYIDQSKYLESNKNMEKMNSSNAQRSKSASAFKSRERVITDLIRKKGESKDETIYSTPKKSNLSQNYMNKSSQQKDSPYNMYISKTVQSKYITSNEKDSTNRFKMNNTLNNEYQNKLFGSSHIDHTHIMSEDDGDEGDDDDEEMQRKRNFEHNMDLKRSILDTEFEQVEDRRRAHLQLLKDSQMNCQFIDILNGWKNQNKKKQFLLEQMQLNNKQQSSEKPQKMMFKSLENIRQNRSQSAIGSNSSRNEKNSNQKKQIFQYININPYGYIIPQTQYSVATQDFFKLKFEKDFPALNDRIVDMKQEISRLEGLIFNQNQLHQNMSIDKQDLVHQIEKRRKSINRKKQLNNEFDEKNEQFHKIKIKINTNMKNTRRNFSNLDKEYQEIDQKSKQILKEQVKRSIENQVTVKHQKNNICNLLIQQDKQQQKLQETEIELQQQEMIEYSYQKRDQDRKDIIQIVKVLEELNTLFVQDQIKYYMNNSKLDEINKYLNIDSSIAFDHFNLDSPLVKYKKRNQQDSPTYVSQNSFLDEVHKFYERHPEGAIALTEKIINRFQFLTSQFESHKKYYNEYNLIKQEKTQEGQQLLSELEQVKDLQDDSPKRMQMKQNIKQEILQTQRGDIIQQLFVEKELNPGIKTYLQTQTLVRDSIRFEKNLLYSFMGLAESFIRKSKVILLMQDDCNVDIGEEFKNQITSSLDKINKMIRNDTKIMKRQNSLKMLDISQGLMKNLGNFKRNLGLKLINQIRLNDSSPKKEDDSDNILIVFNEFSEILIQNHQSYIQPDKNILEKWILTIKNDNIIYGFANQNMIINYLKTLNCTEEQKRDPKFTYVFENLYKLKDSAWKNYYLCICDLIELEQNFILTLKQQCVGYVSQILELNPKFQLKRIRSLKRLQSQYMQKFPFIQSFQNQNQLIKEQNQEAIQRIENQIDHPQQITIERKRVSSENKTNKAEFDIEYFLQKMKTDGQKKFKKEILNDEIARKNEENERRKSSLLYKTNQENYFQFKEYEHFQNNLEEIKKHEEQELDYDEDSPLFIQYYREPNQNYTKQLEKKQKDPYKDNKSSSFRKRVISCDLNKQKQQNKIHQQDLLKPNQIQSARKNLALNSNLLKHISKCKYHQKSMNKDIYRTYTQFYIQQKFYIFKIMNNPDMFNTQLQMYYIQEQQNKYFNKNSNLKNFFKFHSFWKN